MATAPALHRQKWRQQELQDSLSLLLAMGFAIILLTIMAVYAM